MSSHPNNQRDDRNEIMSRVMHKHAWRITPKPAVMTPVSRLQKKFLQLQAIQKLRSKASTAFSKTGSTRLLWRIVAGVAIAALVVGGVGIIHAKLTSANAQIEQHLRAYGQSDAITAYVPTNLPAGYELASSDVTNDNGVIFTVLKNKDATKPDITITQQAIPKDIAIGSILGLIPPVPVDTPNGKLYQTYTDTTTSASLVTPSSWVLFSAQKSLNSSLLKDIATRLKPLN